MERRLSRVLTMNSNNQTGGILLIILAIVLGGFLLWYILSTNPTPPAGIIWERGQPMP